MTTLTSHIQVANNVMYGLLFGYSECCIRYFHMRQVNGDMENPSDPDRNLTGQGFICCPKCDSTKNAFQMHVEIAGRRRIKAPFGRLAEPTREEEDSINVQDDDVVAMAIPIVQEIQRYYDEHYS